MEKKKYIAPEVQNSEMEPTAMIAASIDKAQTGGNDYYNNYEESGRGSSSGQRIGGRGNSWDHIWD